MTKEVKKPQKPKGQRKKNQNIEKNREHSGQSRARNLTRGEPHIHHSED